MKLTRFIYVQNIWVNQNISFWLEKRENVGIKHLNDQEAFIECSNRMDYVYEDIDEYNSTKKIKILIVSDDMIADIMRVIRNSKLLWKNCLLYAEN